MKAWEENVRKVTPYTPGEQPDQANMIKLNTNENPYPPAPGVQKAMEQFDMDTLRLYPDPKASALVDVLADYYHVKPEQVFVGVGSDDVIAMAFQTFFNSDRPILFPDITYSFYPVWADAFKIPYETRPLDENFHIRKEDYYGENGGIIFPNPNAPTSVYEDLDFVEDILKHNTETLVIVDEAYIDFGGKSALELVEKYDNLLVVQTFSKSRSMAGMRIGYAIGHPELIKAMNDFKYSFNSYTMNQPSIVLGAEAVKDDDYFKECTGKIMKTRAWTADALKNLGFEFNEPWANFIFVTHPKYSAKELFDALREEKIYVRYFNLPRIDNYLRITVGTDEEMETLIHFLKEYMK
jgi:histidinol-phosphate aminotransferase